MCLDSWMQMNAMRCILMKDIVCIVSSGLSWKVAVTGIKRGFPAGALDALHCLRNL